MELNMIAAVQPDPPSSYHQDNEQESNYDQQTEKNANPQKEHQVQYQASNISSSNATFVGVAHGAS